MELPADKMALLLNAKIGDVIDGTLVGLSGYKLKITGGSDKSGFPMNSGVEGSRKTKVFRRISVTGRRKGQYRRVSSRGNTISADIEEVNAVITEYGEKSPEELFPKKEKAPKGTEEAKAEGGAKK